MQFVHEDLEVLEHFFVLIEPAVADGVLQRSDSGNDKTDIIPGSFKEEVCGFLVKMIRLHPAKKRSSAHWAKNDSVFDFNVSNLPGSKER